jgi:predicted AlkP superfamily phosphohydrolase/phosphomutase
MRKWAAILVVVLVLLGGLAWYFWPRPPRVVWVGVDAGAHHLLDEYLANGTLPAQGGFAQLVRRGVRAAALPVEISMTGPSFASLYTGAHPERHGLMGNTYYRVTDPLGKTISAFDAPLAAEPIWQTLRRAGKRVIMVGQDIGLATSGPGPDAVLGLGQNDGPSQLVELTAADFAPAEDWQFGRRRFEHARAASFLITTRQYGQHRANLLVADTKRDGRERYDGLLMDFDRDLANGVAAELAPSQWAPVRLPVEHATAIGSWVKLLELAEDLSRVRVYVGGAHYNHGNPVEFVQRLERALARDKTRPFWPGTPDNRALDRGWIDEDTWFEQQAREAYYLRDAAEWVMENERYDLLITYQPQADQAAHEFFLRHMRQQGYADPALRARMAKNMVNAWLCVDANLAEVLEEADRWTTVIVTADHGMIPVHTRFFPNRLLAAQKFRLRGRDAPESGAQVQVITSGAQAHVYINLAGRQPGGVVSAKDYPKVVARLVKLFSEVRDPATGEPVFAVVASREDTARFHILNEGTTGDVWLSLNPGYTFGTSSEPGELFEPAGSIGQHGYLSDFPEMQGLFLAAGPQIRPGRIGVINNVDVAPTVARILGVPPPKDAQGRVLEEIFKPK